MPTLEQATQLANENHAFCEEGLYTLSTEYDPFDKKHKRTLSYIPKGSRLSFGKATTAKNPALLLKLMLLLYTKATLDQQSILATAA